MDGAAQPAPPLAVRRATAVETISSFQYLNGVVHSPPRNIGPNKWLAVWFIHGASTARVANPARTEPARPGACLTMEG